MLNKLKTHQKIFLFSILIVSAIAFFDVLSYKSNIFGTPEDYLVGNYTCGWWSLFFSFGSILIILISLAYYWFGKRDFSESISLFLVSYLWWIYGGISDLLFFIFVGIKIPTTLPWLDENIFIGGISKLFGLSGVTNISLIISVLLSGIILYYLCKFLVENL